MREKDKLKKEFDAQMQVCAEIINRFNAETDPVKKAAIQQEMEAEGNKLKGMKGGNVWVMDTKPESSHEVVVAPESKNSRKEKKPWARAAKK